MHVLIGVWMVVVLLVLIAIHGACNRTANATEATANLLASGFEEAISDQASRN
jgi:hypothetical protein